MDLSRSKEGGTVFLPEDCVIEQAGELAEALRAAAKDKTVVAVDVSAVSRIDLSGLQLLHAFLASGNKGTRKLRLSGAFREGPANSVATAGFSPLLDPYRPARRDADG